MVGTPVGLVIVTHVGLVRVNLDASMVSAATVTTPVATPITATQILQDHEIVFVPKPSQDDKTISSAMSNTMINTENQLDRESDDNTIEGPQSDTPSKDPIQPLHELNVPESDTL